MISENEHQNKTRDELYEEIKYWKSRATSKSISSTPPESENLEKSKKITKYFNSSEAELGIHATDIIDLYATYDTLTEKRSSEEDNKPLSPMSIYRADHYMTFFLCFRFITLQITSNSLSKKIEEGWKSRHPDGATKWLSLLDIKHQDVNLQNSIQRVKNDRVQLFQSNILPFSNIQDSDNIHAEYVVRSIEELLPGRLVFDVLVNFFFKYIWPLKPFIDEELFKQDIKRLITYDDTGLKSTIRLSQRSDFAILSTLLIILRYTSTAVQVIDDKDLSIFLLPLKQYAISVKVISLAQMCLSMYKLLKKTSLHMIQALLYLRVYYKDCPEDGDGLTLGQSQVLFGMIVQSALSIGLHRDPEHYAVSSDVKIANIRRRIWYGIVALDTQTGILSGSLSAVPASSLTCVKFPIITLGDPLERAQLDELEKEVGLQTLERELVEAINKMDAKPNLSKLVELLDSIRHYVNEHYSMSFMSPISDHDDSSQIYKAAILRNYKIIEKNLIVRCSEITVYQFLYIQYEDNKRLSPEMFYIFYKRCLESITAGFDISSAYLSGALKNYVNHIQSNHSLFPIITSLTYRIVNAVTATMLRCFHSQELLNCELFATDTAELTDKDFEKFLAPLCNICENHLNIYEQTIGAKYHLSLKVICSCKFSYSALKKHKFSVLNKIVSFLETNDDTKVTDIFWQGAKMEDIRTIFQLHNGMFEVYAQWMQLNKSYKGVLQAHDSSHQPICDAIINVSHTNHFTGLSAAELDEFVEILTGGSKYCSVSASTNNVEEQFAKGASSSSDSYDFYDLLAQDPMFNAQMSNVLQKSKSSFMSNESNPPKHDLINELFGPTVDTVGQFDDFLKY